MQVPTVTVISQAVKRLCDNIIKLAKLPDSKQRVNWTPVGEPWPLQDSFGGIDIMVRRDDAGNILPMPSILECWDNWSKMLFIKDRLVALFADTTTFPFETLWYAHLTLFMCK
jgi:hypothetical protein